MLVIKGSITVSFYLQENEFWEEIPYKNVFINLKTSNVLPKGKQGKGSWMPLQWHFNFSPFVI